MIVTCTSGAAEPELCDVHVLSVIRIDRIVVTFFKPEAGYDFEHLFCCLKKERKKNQLSSMHDSFRLGHPPY